MMGTPSILIFKNLPREGEDQTNYLNVYKIKKNIYILQATQH